MEAFELSDAGVLANERMAVPGHRNVIGELVDRSYRSLQGHVVIRVFPPGDTYAVYILNHLNTERNVINVFGPYPSKVK